MLVARGTMQSSVILLACACVACGNSKGGNADANMPHPDAAVPEARCNAPALYDVSAPTATVGDGSAASCTETALRTAASGGGTIVFNCGTDPVTITVTSTIMVTKETVIDGGGLITLSGGGTTRILYLDSDFNTPTPRLVVQRMSFKDGKSTATGVDTAGGGAAIYRDGGSLTVINSVFENNHAPTTGQDLAGGAIYGFGGGETVIVGSSFTANAASDGGAVGSLQGDLTIINSTFANNAATGDHGNPGNGGCGGAIYMDGKSEAASLCGVTIQSNTAGAIGGGVFRVSNTHDGTFAMDRSTVDNNQVTASGDGNAGGLYLEGLTLTITASTISRNQAFYNGGLWINQCNMPASDPCTMNQTNLTNVTIAENVATGSNGGGLWLGHNPVGTIKNCTIANNRATASGQIAGAIFGSGLTLVNTIVANNTAMYTPSCDDKRTDGSGNLQWPNSALCTTGPLVADPMLGALGDNGGDSETLLPASGSPAKAIATGCPPTDQLGNARPEPCTAGAVEAP
jgi:hypothetical protein